MMMMIMTVMCKDHLLSKSLSLLSRSSTWEEIRSKKHLLFDHMTAVTSYHNHQFIVRACERSIYHRTHLVNVQFIINLSPYQCCSSWLRPPPGPEPGPPPFGSDLTQLPFLIGIIFYHLFLLSIYYLLSFILIIYLWSGAFSITFFLIRIITRIIIFCPFRSSLCFVNVMQASINQAAW